MAGVLAEAPSMRSGVDEKLVQRTIPVKVKNTFIDVEDYAVQDSAEGRAAPLSHDWKRQASEPAPSAYAFQAWTCPEFDEAPSTSQPTVFDCIADPQPPQQLQQGMNRLMNGAETTQPMHVQAGIPDLTAAMAGLMLDPGDGVSALGQSPGADMASAVLANSVMPPVEWGDTTTVMMRNLPNKYTQKMLLGEINNTGFLGTYDFLYLPIDPETQANRGYAFVNFIQSGIAWSFKSFYEGRKMSRFNSNKVVNVVPATLQGFEANYAHYASARVNRGDPAARPLFLREPAPQQTFGPWAGGMGGRGGGRRGRGGGGQGAAGGRAPQQMLWQVAAAMAATGQHQGPGAGVEAGPADGMSFGGQAPKFCPHCGGAIQQFFQFCPQCGASLDFGAA